MKKIIYTLALSLSLISCTKHHHHDIVGYWEQISIEPTFANEEIWKVEFLCDNTFEDYYSDYTYEERAFGKYSIDDKFLVMKYREGIVDGEPYEDEDFNYFYYIENIDTETGTLILMFIGDDDPEGEDNIHSLKEAKTIERSDYLYTLTLKKKEYRE